MGSCSFLLLTKGPMNSETFLKWLLTLVRLPFSFYKPAGICAVCLQYAGWFYVLFIATSLVLLELQTKLVVRRRRWKVCRASNCWRRLHKPTISTSSFLRRHGYARHGVGNGHWGRSEQVRPKENKAVNWRRDSMHTCADFSSLICFLQFLHHTSIYSVSS